MSKKTKGRGRSPRLADYIKAAMPGVRMLAKIEKIANVTPGSLIESATLRGGRAGDWAGWIASGYVLESGQPWTDEEEKALARRLRPIFRERGRA